MRDENASDTGPGVVIARAYANAQDGDLAYGPTSGGARLALSPVPVEPAAQQTGSSLPVSTS